MIRVSQFKESGGFSSYKYKSDVFSRNYYASLCTDFFSSESRSWQTNYYVSGMVNNNCSAYVFRDNLWTT